MPLTEVGLPLVAEAIVRGFGGGSPVTLWFGIGDGDAPFDASQVDLQGVNKVRRPLLSEFPRVSGLTVYFAADFEPESAPFELKEFGLFDAPVGGSMLCRLLVDDPGSMYPQHTARPQISVTVALSKT